MIKIIKVSDKGQIALPQPMRAILGIERGDDLIVVQIDNKILLQKAQIVEKNLKDDFKNILKFNEQSLKEFWDNKENDIWNKYLRGKRC
jgi:AbrB family looped-hinge helix DNA binding protein